MKKSIFAIGMLACMTFTASAAVSATVLELKHGDKAAEKAYFAQPHRIWGTNTYKAKPTDYNGLLVLGNSKTKFVFHLVGKMKNGKPVDVEIGMLRPSVYNWYAGGFIVPRGKQTELKKGVFSIGKVQSGAKSGFAELNYKGVFSGTIRLELMDNDDKLLVTFTPADKTIPYRLDLYAYPGHYGDAKKPFRKVFTSAGDIAVPKNLTKQESWAVFYDTYYDRKVNRGDGCCAFLYNPNETDVATMRAGYACLALLNYKKGTTAHLIFWDFKGWSSDQAKDYMKKLKFSFK